MRKVFSDPFATKEDYLLFIISILMMPSVDLSENFGAVMLSLFINFVFAFVILFLLVRPFYYKLYSRIWDYTGELEKKAKEIEEGYKELEQKHIDFDREYGSKE